MKESVFPFIKFAGVDIVLGPEMRSTGEVMGISERFSMAFAKSQLAAGTVLPHEGNIFVSVAERHKPAVRRPGEAAARHRLQAARDRRHRRRCWKRPAFRRGGVKKISEGIPTCSTS